MPQELENGNRDRKESRTATHCVSDHGDQLRGGKGLAIADQERFIARIRMSEAGNEDIDKILKRDETAAVSYVSEGKWNILVNKADEPQHIGLDFRAIDQWQS